MYHQITQSVAVRIVSLSHFNSDSWNPCGNLFAEICFESSILWI